MLRKVRTIAIAAIISMGGVISAASPAAAATDSIGCTALDQTHTWVITYRYAADIPEIPTATFFNQVRGDATARQLKPCFNYNGTGGVSSVLPANMEGPGGHIYQVGFSGWSTGSLFHDEFAFVYTPYGNGVAVRWPKNLYPVVGTRFRFIVQRQWMTADGGYWAAKYSIIRLLDNYTEVVYGDWFDNDRPYMAWYGAEGQNYNAEVGTECNPCDPIDLQNLGYAAQGQAFQDWYVKPILNSSSYDNESDSWYSIDSIYDPADTFNVYSHPI